MSLFKKNHLEAVDKECQVVAQLSAQIREKCDRSLRGKFEMMQPEQRATLLKDAHGLYRKLMRALEAAREEQARMTEEHADNEEAVLAHGRVLAATMDSQRAQSAMEEGRKSLREGLVEVEGFFGASSSEAKHVRKVLAELEAH